MIISALTYSFGYYNHPAWNYKFKTQMWDIAFVRHM